jgi:fructose-1,6-bisphosphatase I
VPKEPRSPATDPDAHPTLADHLAAHRHEHQEAHRWLLGRMADLARDLTWRIEEAALTGRLGLSGVENPTGDRQKKLDAEANRLTVDAFRRLGPVAAIVSEEMDEVREISCQTTAPYVLTVDPVDGSSNTDVAAPLATVFGFFRRTGTDHCGPVEDELGQGARLELAGYVLYGSSTVLVVSDGGRSDAFTLDRRGAAEMTAACFRHSATLACPSRGPNFAANLGHSASWPSGARRFADLLLLGGEDGDAARGENLPYHDLPHHTLRYSGALAADLHRILFEGGVYLYPADRAHPQGKLRLLYECMPLALVAESAGGRASDGRRRILDLAPRGPHDRSPLVLGSRDEVELYERLADDDAG